MLFTAHFQTVPVVPKQLSADSLTDKSLARAIMDEVTIPAHEPNVITSETLSLLTPEQRIRFHMTLFSIAPPGLYPVWNHGTFIGYAPKTTEGITVL